MTYRYFYTPLGWLALWGLPLVSTAQTQAAPAPIAFKSVFEGYQPFTDDPAGRWREANDTTARIGGWRAYAKEAAQAVLDKTAQPAPVVSPEAPVVPVVPVVPALKSSSDAAAVKP